MNVKTDGELRTARHLGLLRTFRFSEAPKRLHQVQLCVALRKNQIFSIALLATTFIAEFFFFSAPVIGAFAIRALRWFRLFADSFLGYDTVAIVVAL